MLLLSIVVTNVLRLCIRGRALELGAAIIQQATAQASLTLSVVVAECTFPGGVRRSATASTASRLAAAIDYSMHATTAVCRGRSTGISERTVSTWSRVALTCVPSQEHSQYHIVHTSICSSHDNHVCNTAAHTIWASNGMLVHRPVRLPMQSTVSSAASMHRT